MASARSVADRWRAPARGWADALAGPPPAKAARPQILADPDALPPMSALAASDEPALARAVRDACLSVVPRIDMAALEEAARRRSELDAERVLLVDLMGEALRVAVEPRLAAMFRRGADLAADELRASGVPVKQLRADLEVPYAQAGAWARAQGSALVREVTRRQRAAIRDLIARAHEQGITVDEVARRLRDTVGLRDDQERAVLNFRNRLYDAGLDPAAVERRTASYARAQLRLRARTIARTELVASANGGQQALWDEAVRVGALDPSRMMKRWIVTDDERLCERCEAVGEGGPVAIGADFREPGRAGARVPHPPLHPNCRCAMGLVPAPSGKGAGVPRSVAEALKAIDGLPAGPDRTRAIDGLFGAFEEDAAFGRQPGPPDVVAYVDPADAGRAVLSGRRFVDEGALRRMVETFEDWAHKDWDAVDYLKASVPVVLAGAGWAHNVLMGTAALEGLWAAIVNGHERFAASLLLNRAVKAIVRPLEVLSPRPEPAFPILPLPRAGFDPLMRKAMRASGAFWAEIEARFQAPLTRPDASALHLLEKQWMVREAYRTLAKHMGDERAFEDVGVLIEGPSRGGAWRASTRTITLGEHVADMVYLAMRQGRTALTEGVRLPWRADPLDAGEVYLGLKTFMHEYRHAAGGLDRSYYVTENDRMIEEAVVELSARRLASGLAYGGLGGAAQQELREEIGRLVERYGASYPGFTGPIAWYVRQRGGLASELYALIRSPDYAARRQVAADGLREILYVAARRAHPEFRESQAARDAILGANQESLLNGLRRGGSPDRAERERSWEAAIRPGATWDDFLAAMRENLGYVHTPPRPAMAAERSRAVGPIAQRSGFDPWARHAAAASGDFWARVERDFVGRDIDPANPHGPPGEAYKAEVVSRGLQALYGLLAREARLRLEPLSFRPFYRGEEIIQRGYNAFWEPSTRTIYLSAMTSDGIFDLLTRGGRGVAMTSEDMYRALHAVLHEQVHVHGWPFDFYKPGMEAFVEEAVVESTARRMTASLLFHGATREQRRLGQQFLGHLATERAYWQEMAAAQWFSKRFGTHTFQRVRATADFRERAGRLGAQIRPWLYELYRTRYPGHFTRPVADAILTAPNASLVNGWRLGSWETLDGAPKMEWAEAEGYLARFTGYDPHGRVSARSAQRADSGPRGGFDARLRQAARVADKFWSFVDRRYSRWRLGSSVPDAEYWRIRDKSNLEAVTHLARLLSGDKRFTLTIKTDENWFWDQARWVQSEGALYMSEGLQDDLFWLLRNGKTLLTPGNFNLDSYAVLEMVNHELWHAIGGIDRDVFTLAGPRPRLLNDRMMEEGVAELSARRSTAALIMHGMDPAARRRFVDDSARSIFRRASANYGFYVREVRWFERAFGNQAMLGIQRAGPSYTARSQFAAALIRERLLRIARERHGTELADETARAIMTARPDQIVRGWREGAWRRVDEERAGYAYFDSMVGKYLAARRKFRERPAMARGQAGDDFPGGFDAYARNAARQADGFWAWLDARRPSLQSLRGVGGQVPTIEIEEAANRVVDELSRILGGPRGIRVVQGFGEVSPHYRGALKAIVLPADIYRDFFLGLRLGRQWIMGNARGYVAFRTVIHEISHGVGGVGDQYGEPFEMSRFLEEARNETQSRRAAAALVFHGVPGAERRLHYYPLHRDTIYYPDIVREAVWFQRQFGDAAFRSIYQGGAGAAFEPRAAAAAAILKDWLIGVARRRYPAEVARMRGAFERFIDDRSPQELVNGWMQGTWRRVATDYDRPDVTFAEFDEILTDGFAGPPGGGRDVDVGINLPRYIPPSSNGFDRYARRAAAAAQWFWGGAAYAVAHNATPSQMLQQGIEAIMDRIYGITEPIQIIVDPAQPMWIARWDAPTRRLMMSGIVAHWFVNALTLTPMGVVNEPMYNAVRTILHELRHATSGFARSTLRGPNDWFMEEATVDLSATRMAAALFFHKASRRVKQRARKALKPLRRINNNYAVALREAVWFEQKFGRRAFRAIAEAGDDYFDRARVAADALRPWVLAEAKRRYAAELQAEPEIAVILASAPDGRFVNAWMYGRLRAFDASKRFTWKTFRAMVRKYLGRDRGETFPPGTVTNPPVGP